MLKIIRDQIQRLLDDIDSGNTNASEEELIDIADTINKILYKPQDMSKYAACQYLNVSRATFDNYIREGKLPKGKHIIGFKELRWEKKELDECLKNIKQHNT
jgi:predicted DNA-binding transcriptional regulator AlpA